MASYQFNPINILDTSNATSLTDGGSMTLGGGISIGKDTLIGGNISISGTTTSFSDNILLINKNPSTSTDTGIIFQRYSADIQNNKNYAGIIYSEQNDTFNLGYLVSDADRNYVSMGSLIPIIVKDITTGNVNFTGDLYKGGTLYNPSQWTTSNSDIFYTSGKVITSNLTTTNISGSNLRLSGDLYVGGTLSTVNVTTTNVMDINISTGTINVSGMSNFTNVIATNISTGTFIASTSISSGLLSATNSTITNAVVTTASVGTLVNINAVSTNATTNSMCVTGSLNVNNFIDSATIQSVVNPTKSNGLHYWYSESNIASNEFIWGPSLDEFNPELRSYILNNTGKQLNTKIRFTGVAENHNFSNSMTGKFYIANSSGTLVTTIYEYTVDMATGEDDMDPTFGTLSIDTGYITVVIPIGGSIRVTDNYPNNDSASLKTNGTLYISVLNDTIFTTTSGNVGIGTNSPSYKLDVSGTGRFTSKLTITGSAGATGFDTATNDQYADMRVIRNSSSSLDKDMYLQLGAGATSTLHMFSNNSETMTIKSGNVGISTTNPTAKLHVGGSIRLDAETATDLLGSTDSANLTQTYISFGFAGTSNDVAYLRQIGGWNSYKMALDIHDDGDEPGFCIRSVTSTANPDTINERFTVQANGNVGIGTSSPSGMLHLNGSALFTSTGNLTCTGDIVSFGSLSDQRLKENVLDINNDVALQTVRSFRPVTFDWRDDVFNESKRNTSDVGFIAQQLEPLVPLAVSEYTEIGSGVVYKRIKHERLIPYLVGAIKSLDHDNYMRKDEHKIEALQQESEQNKIIIQNLIQRIEILESQMQNN